METDLTWNAGDLLKIAAHYCDPGRGLSYRNHWAIAAEPGRAGGWDVYDERWPEADVPESFYGFSVLQVIPQAEGEAR